MNTIIRNLTLPIGLIFSFFLLISCTKSEDKEGKKDNELPQINHKPTFIEGSWEYVVEKKCDILLEFDKDGTYKKIETGIFDIVPSIKIDKGPYQYDEESKILLCYNDEKVDKYKVKILNDQSIGLQQYNTETNDYDEEKEFSRNTSNNNIKLTLYEVNEISDSSAVVMGTIIYESGITIKEKGLCYSKTSNPSIKDEKVISKTDVVNQKISVLEEESIYYVRLYATTSDSTYYGKEMSFSTLKSEDKIKLSDCTVESITNSTANIKGYILGESVDFIERGVCYSTKPSPTIDNTKISVKTDVVNTTILNLQEVTTYYVRLYATTSKGTTYGKETSFTTERQKDRVEFSECTIKDLDYTNVYIIGSITSYNMPILECGICYSTQRNPTERNEKCVTQTQDFIKQLTNLKEGTRYYVRLYAITANETFYGKESEFTTLINPTHVEDKSLKAKIVEVSKRGYVDLVLENRTKAKVGFCASTSPYPVITDLNTPESNLGGVAFERLHLPASGTTYYIRPYHVSGGKITYYESTTVETLGNNIQLSLSFPSHSHGEIYYNIKKEGTYELSVQYGFNPPTGLGYVGKGSAYRTFSVDGLWDYFRDCTVRLYCIETDIIYEDHKPMGKED